MSRTAQLTELEQQRPELGVWLAPLRVALSALADPAWQQLVPLCDAHRSPAAPLLHGATVPIAEDLLYPHVRSVLHAALHTDARGMDAAQLIEAAVAHDDAVMAAQAESASIDAHALRAAAQLAAIPLLIRSAQAVAPKPLENWTESFCHVCGALPSSLEVLGLERTRQLRCGRCGAAWRTRVLLCAYCGERDHAKVTALVPDGAQGQIIWTETCETCHGYIKTRAALRAVPADQLLIEDARSIELDLVALDRGYQKPAGGFRTALRVVTTAGGIS